MSAVRAALGAALALALAAAVLLWLRDDDSGTAGSTPGAASSAAVIRDREARLAKGFPDASDTGVPDGMTLTTYDGPCTITTAAHLDAVDATGCGALLVRAAGVRITRSRTPVVDATAGGDASVTIIDSTVRGGAWSEGAVWGSGITLLRDDVTGGQHSVHCIDDCTVVDSWLHDQYEDPAASFHNNAFISNGGAHMVVRHNTLHCTARLNANGGGCTADLSLFGDFDPISDVLVEDNLFKANHRSISYCTYGGSTASKVHPVASDVRYLDNTFEPGAHHTCGVYGPATDFVHGSGNQWRGNVWVGGGAVSPN